MMRSDRSNSSIEYKSIINDRTCGWLTVHAQRMLFDSLDFVHISTRDSLNCVLSVDDLPRWRRRKFLNLSLSVSFFDGREVFVVSSYSKRSLLGADSIASD